jgi:hypothetical protein
MICGCDLVGGGGLAWRLLGGDKILGESGRVPLGTNVARSGVAGRFLSGLNTGGEVLGFFGEPVENISTLISKW